MKNTLQYHQTVQKLRKFFLDKNFIEVPTQSRLSILAACEDPHTVSTFNYDGVIWPLPQTGQMWLEYELLKNPTWEGVFCISTSYRNEPNPVEGRHEKIFPMFEFESKGSYFDLINLEMELLYTLGFNEVDHWSYDELCEKYKTDLLTSEHETQMEKDFGNAIFLKYFPERTSPFWNMKHMSNGLFNKSDVILFGQETIGSAERSCNKDEMRHFFYTISNGGYANKLFELFGKERVEKELEEFLSLDFFPRFGAGVGINRLCRACEKLKK